MKTEKRCMTGTKGHHLRVGSIGTAFPGKKRVNNLTPIKKKIGNNVSIGNADEVEERSLTQLAHFERSVLFIKDEND
jgi:hypothetical protein